MQHFHVAAGILRDGDGRILITERLCDGPFDGLWEFPGGKIADSETVGAALERELREELGITVTGYRPFIDLCHAYSDRTVDLEFFLVTAWLGEPRGVDGQRLRWVLPEEMDPAELLPADAPVVNALRDAQQMLS
jgi:8-oxo-dGTP diphosphatase